MYVIGVRTPGAGAEVVDIIERIPFGAVFMKVRYRGKAHIVFGAKGSERIHVGPAAGCSMPDEIPESGRALAP